MTNLTKRFYELVLCFALVTSASGRGSRRNVDGCVYSFDVWKPDKNAERRLDDIEKTCRSTKREIISEMNRIKSDMFRDLKGLYNNTMMVQRESLEQKVQIMDLLLKVKSLTTQIKGVDRSVENIDKVVMHNKVDMTQLRKANTTLPADIMAQMKNSMGNLKAEWLLIKRQIQDVRSESYILKVGQNDMESQRQNIVDALDTLRNDTNFLIRGYDVAYKQTIQNAKSLATDEADLMKIKNDLSECKFDVDLLKKDEDDIKSNILSIKKELNVLTIESTNIQHEFYDLARDYAATKDGAWVGGKNRAMKDTTQTSTASITTSKPEAEIQDTARPTNAVPKDCQDVYSQGFHTSGAYEILPSADVIQDRVYCEMVNGSGWTVIQRRIDGLVDFNKRWLEYKYGFGNIYGEFWLGNERIHQLTKGNDFKLRVDMWDWEGKRAYAEYGNFMVEDEKNAYRLHVRHYSGTGGDSLSYHNAMAFSTEDVDNDLHARSCAVDYKSGWWFERCYNSNLNGIYQIGWYNKGRSNFADGIVWYALKGDDFYSLKAVEMKIKPN